jgi:hypothetical protein
MIFDHEQHCSAYRLAINTIIIAKLIQTNNNTGGTSYETIICFR